MARIQSTGMVYAGSGTNVVLTFPAPVSPGNLIVVEVSMKRSFAAAAVTVDDNQAAGGNPYTQKGPSPNRNDSKADVWYAFNVVAVGTFTITVHSSGGDQETIAVAVEHDGFGSTDPFLDVVMNTGVDGFPNTGTAPAIGIANALVCAAMSTSGFVNPINVETVVPAWVEDGEIGAHCGVCQTGECDSRYVTDAGPQSCSWTMAGSTWSAMLVIFSPVNVPSDIYYTQAARSVLYQDDSDIRLTQMARAILYPFTCVPGRPPAVTGCPETVPMPPVQGDNGCADTLE